MVKINFINTTEHVGGMVGDSSNLTSGLEFEAWECSCIMQ